MPICLHSCAISTENRQINTQIIISGHVIKTFLKRVLNDPLYCYIERLTNVSMMFSQRSTSLMNTLHYL